MSEGSGGIFDRIKGVAQKIRGHGRASERKPQVQSEKGLIDIADVRVVSRHEAGIPVKGWEGVKAALEIFAGGTAEENGPYVEKVLNEAKSSLAENTEWWRNYDWDAIRTPFLKTYVGVSKAKEPDSYVVKFLKPGGKQMGGKFYREEEVEEAVAKALGIKRGLISEKVEIQCEEDNGNSEFGIDFDRIAERLQNFAKELGTEGLIGAAIADKLMRRDSKGFGEGPFVLGNKNGVKITIDIEGERTRWNDEGELEDKWHQDGAIISGQKFNFRPQPVAIRIQPEQRDGDDKVSVATPEQEVLMHSLSAKIATAFGRRQ